MTAKEKAKELIDKFDSEISVSDFHIPEFISGVPCADVSVEYSELLDRETVLLAKECALIAVDEILSEYSVLQIETNFCYKQWLFWSEVKQEIEKL